MTEKYGTILFVEDDRVDQMAFTRFAGDGSFPYDYVLAGSVHEALKKLSGSTKFVAIVLDYLLGDGTAFDLFDTIHGIPIILVTGTGDIDVAIKAMKRGAYDYLEKDPHGNYLRALTITVETAILRKQADDELVVYRKRLEELVDERTTELRKAVDKYKDAREQIDQAFTMQQMINQLLQSALEPITLEQHLEKVLGKILDLPWNNMDKRGAIFLIDDDRPEILHLKAAKGLNLRQQEVCRRVPVGTCICGKAAQCKKIQVIDCDDNRHEIALSDNEPHTHYCVPILTHGDKVLGVISLYFKRGHVSTALEKEHFVVIARTLASVMEHFRANKKKDDLTQQLMQAQKMESIGRLAGGVAHDFNNILGAINGYAELILLKLAEDNDNPIKGYGEIILASGERAAGLTQQLLAFSRKEVVQSKVLNLNNVINEGQKILARLIGEDVAVELTYADDLWNIKADPTQINQIIMNLAVNSRDAMPNGGKLTIETKNVVLDDCGSNFSGNSQGREFVRLRISDNGVGMSKEVMAQIFDPFYTTKEVGKGTGLGLSTVYGIVQQNNGNIKVESEPGQGAAFIINFPMTEEKDKKTANEQLSAMPHGSETILIAEDDSQVRTLIVNLLKSLGYRVLEAENGIQALDICKTEQISLLLTDVIMPEMSGDQLFTRMEDCCPEVKVIFMSGYTGESETIQKVLKRGVEFLQKPIALNSLAQTVRKVLDRKLGSYEEN